MINIAIGIVVLFAFIGLTLLVSARDGVARVKSVWAAQSISLLLVCVLMVAGGFIFKGIVD